MTRFVAYEDLDFDPETTDLIIEEVVGGYMVFDTWLDKDIFDNQL